MRRSRTGTGLGLFIVHSVVKGHRGTVIGGQPGSRQRLDLHRHPARRHRDSAARRVRGAAQRPWPSILVVEDEEHLAIGIKFNLELEGFEVDVVGRRRARRWRGCAPAGDAAATTS